MLEHALPDGDSLSGRADVEHDLRPGALHVPLGPRAAAVLDGDERAQLVLHARVAAEMDAQAVQIRMRYAPGGALVGSSRDDGNSTTWSVLVARSLIMRAMIRICLHPYFTPAPLAAGTAIAI